MTRHEHIENQAAANARWFFAAMCFLHWARVAKQPPTQTLELLEADIAALAQGDHHADLKCLAYPLYATPQPPRRRQRRSKVQPR